MRSRQIALILIGLIMMVFVCGCVQENAAQPDNTNNGQSQALDSSKTETQMQIYEKNQPIPQLQFSLERANLIRRLNWINAADKLIYVALLSNDGKVLATYTTHKISSVNSMLTTTEQIVPSQFHDLYHGDLDWGHVVASPDIDGSYSTNGNGVFFFTTDNQYVEWNGLYLEQSSPFVLITPPTITKGV